MNRWPAGVAAAFLMATVASAAVAPDRPAWNAMEPAGQVATGTPVTGYEPPTAGEPPDITPPQMAHDMGRMKRMRGGGAVTVRDGSPEVRKRGKTSENTTSPFDKLRPYWETATRCWIPAAVVGGLLVAGCVVGVCLRRRVRYLLPVVEVEPRLDGDRAAGIGAVISFANAAVSLTSQRDRL